MSICDESPEDVIRACWIDYKKEGTPSCTRRS